MKNQNIVSIVVTFNRKESLLQNIKQQLIQNYNISYLLIIDNASTDGTESFLHQNDILQNEKVIYIKLKENMGGAGGFEKGVLEAMETDADAFVLMDDDGFMLNENTISKLVEKIDDKELFMINSLVVSDDMNTLSFVLNKSISTKESCYRHAKNGVIENLISPFNGTLVSRKLVEKIGLPNGNLFIRGDEVDYRVRAATAGAYIATVVDSMYYHPAPTAGTTKKFLGIKFCNYYDSPWKEYYGLRNTTYLTRKKSKIKAYLKYKKLCFGTRLFKIEDRKNLLRYLKLAYSDGVKGKLGKTIMPGDNDYFKRKQNDE